ncbi:SLC13 family permease [Salaquimonas pukyongi]|uniref:SLC13 family permease n=1 Tax=Salaquimonas pukyongi TaxID=2712698 RepID=UPI00096BA2C5|nr:SLC13 family permease [Salaquimonas pukyongi]
MELYFLALLILIMAAALGSGYPVAFALPGAAIITIFAAAVSGWLFAGNTDAFFHSGGPQQWLSAGVTNLRGVYWEVERDTLIAIPLFIFMGITLQRSKIAEDLLVTMAQLFGPVPGGLGISVVFVGALLAATTGIVGATVVAMGLISLPAMLRNKYSPSLATGTIAASGTLGQIIPPSIVLIILADQLASAVDQASTARKALYKDTTGELTMPSAFDVVSTSAGEMFLGAFVPGLLLVLLYMIYILVYALLRPTAAPAVHYAGKFDFAFWRKVFLTLVPPLTLIFLVLGSIIAGIATVNQAGAIGAAGAMVMAGYRLGDYGRWTFVPAILSLIGLGILAFAISNFEMNLKSIDNTHDWIGIQLGILGTIILSAALIWSGWRTMRVEETLNGIMLETAKTTALVFVILLGAAMLTAAFRAFGGEDLVRDFLNSLPGGFWAKFIIVMAVIFVLGFFLDFIEIAVVVVPIVAPILLADPSANVTAVWLGVMIGLNIQTSFLTPPFGFALFYLRGVAPAVVKTIQMYKGVVAFILLQLLALFIVGLYPQMVNYLPNRVSLLSETAPPPRNPKLQYCLEEYVAEQFAANGTQLQAAHETARNIDLSFLPGDLASSFAEGVDKASNAQALLGEAQTARQAINDASPQYRVLHTKVRDLQTVMRGIDSHIAELRADVNRLPGDANAEAREKRLAEIEKLEAEKEGLQAQIPAEWDSTFKTYNDLVKAEEKALNTYRRNSDSAYGEISEVVATLKGSARFLELEDGLRTQAGRIGNEDAESLAAEIDVLADEFGEVEGASKIRSEVSKARRALEAKTPDPDKAATAMANAIDLYEEQKAWREKAGSVLPDLETYDATIRNTIGARVQDRMPRDVALFVASCSADHRDISLNF